MTLIIAQNNEVARETASVRLRLLRKVPTPVAAQNKEHNSLA